jgi:hypothetical protein
MEIRTLIQVNSGTWQTVQIAPFTSSQDYLAWVLTGTTGRPSYEFIASAKGLPEDANVTYDSNGYYEFAIPPYAPTKFPPAAASVFFRPSYVDGFYIGNHALTWLTLAELESYDWTQRWTYPIDVSAGSTPIKNAGAACLSFHDELIPLMVSLAAQYSVNHDNIRLIIGLVN